MPATPCQPKVIFRTKNGLRSSLLSRWVSLRATWRERRSCRFDLERLLETSPHLISDIGMTREEAQQEIAKRFWEA